MAPGVSRMAVSRPGRFGGSWAALFLSNAGRTGCSQAGAVFAGSVCVLSASA